jgi:hypothetical protein
LLAVTGAPMAPTSFIKKGPSGPMAELMFKEHDPSGRAWEIIGCQHENAGQAGWSALQLPNGDR